MRAVRQSISISLTIIITACNLASPTSAPPSAGDPPPAPSKGNPTESPRPNQPAEFPTPAPGGSADIIFANGVILTMDDANPRAEAVAVQGNTILAVGAIEQVFQHRGTATILVDLEGQTLVPGFIDSHQHRILNALEGKSDLDTNLDNAIMQGWTSINELYIVPDFMPQYISLNEQGTLRGGL